MVEILAETPEVHVTFNLVPSLLDQIEAYVSGEAREAELRARPRPRGSARRGREGLPPARRVHGPSGEPDRPLPPLRRAPGPRVARAMTRPRCAWSRRASAPRRPAGPPGPRPSWPGSTSSGRRGDPALRALIAKGRDYTEDDKRVLAERERALLAAVIPAYRRAAEQGRVELSASPYYHPILPLLCDSDVHREAHPGAYVPRRFRHPEDAADQIRRAIDRHTQVFGRPPVGNVAVRGIGFGGSGHGDGARGPALDGLRRGRPRAQHPAAPASRQPGHGPSRRPPLPAVDSPHARRGDRDAVPRPDAERPHRVQLFGLGSGACRPRPPRADPPHRRDLDPRRQGRRSGGADHPGRRERLGALPRRRPGLPAAVLRRPAGRSAPAGRHHERGHRGRRAPRAAARLRGELDPRGLLGVDRPCRRPARLGPAGGGAGRAERGRERRPGPAGGARTRARGLPGRGGQRLVLVVRRRPLVRERHRVRPPVPPPSARRCTRPSAFPRRRPSPRRSSPRAISRCGRAVRRARSRPSSTARSRPRTSGKRPGCTGCRSRARCTGARRACAPSASAPTAGTSSLLVEPSTGALRDLARRGRGGGDLPRAGEPALSCAEGGRAGAW